MGNEREKQDEKGPDVEDSEVKRLHTRIDQLTSAFNSFGEKVIEAISEIKVIKKTCESRGKTSREMNIILRGGAEQGGRSVIERLAIVEKRDSNKDRFAWLTIGCLGTGAFSLLIMLVVHLVG